MGSLIAKWFIAALAFLAAAYIVPGIDVASAYTALILALLWGVLNTLVRPILIVLTLPVTVVTLGLFTLVINGFLFWLLGTFVKGFAVEGFFAAIIGAAVVTLIQWLGAQLVDRIS
ncbi:MAG: phage holin family protein [Parcubacteria group bacterium]|nr:phage holin family protein [Parcubacteria group bacterium]